MQKKKSYMNINSILSEGFLDNILKPFIPKDLKVKIKKDYIAKLEKEKKESDIRLEKILDELEAIIDKEISDNARNKVKQAGVK